MDGWQRVVAHCSNCNEHSVHTYPLKSTILDFIQTKLDCDGRTRDADGCCKVRHLELGDSISTPFQSDALTIKTLMNSNVYLFLMHARKLLGDFIRLTFVQLRPSSDRQSLRVFLQTRAMGGVIDHFDQQPKHL